jgi:acetyl-CoA C-acetyltransferase
MKMGNRVCIVGIGVVERDHAFSELSHKELLFRATRQALDDAGLERKDIGGAVTATYDFLEGRSLSNQYTLDSIGGVMKPCDLRLAEDGIYSLFAGCMEVMADPSQIVVVASVQKGSEIDMQKMAYPKLMLASMEPIFARPVCNAIPDLSDLEPVLASMDAKPFLNRTGLTEKHLERVAFKNLKNSRPDTKAKSDSYQDILKSDMLSWPIRSRMRSTPTDAACTLILCSEKRAKKILQTPVFITGIGWASDIGHLATREPGVARETLWAARHAYDMAGIKRPNSEFDVAEISDWFPHRELMHCEALGFCSAAEISQSVLEGVFESDGKLPVNVSGGLLGKGNAIGTSGLIRVAQVGLQIRGQANGHQVPNAELGLAHSWGGPPLATAGVAILSKW